MIDTKSPNSLTAIVEKRVLAASGHVPNECSCDTCKNMCHASPCIPTIDECINLIEAGHADKLMLSTIVRPGYSGQCLAPIQTDKGCIFLDENNLCTLHDKGLKPVEGRLASHAEGGNGDKLRAVVLASWQSPMAKHFLRIVNQ